MITRERCRNELKQIVLNIQSVLNKDHNVYDMKEVVVTTLIKLGHLSFDLGSLWMNEVSAGTQRITNK